MIRCNLPAQKNAPGRFNSDAGPAPPTVVLCRLLEMKGYVSTWIGSGADALALTRAHPKEEPLLLVLDDMMPEMSGVQFLEILRADARLQHTTVIMYSAGFDLAHLDKAIALGAVAWILKGGAAGGTIETVIKTIIEWYEKVGGVMSARLASRTQKSRR